MGYLSGVTSDIQTQINGKQASGTYVNTINGTGGAFSFIGPGVSAYSVKSKLGSSLTPAEKEQLRDAVQQVLTQRFPGLNYVLGDDELDGNGVLNTTSVGFRYIIHIGFTF